MASRIAVEEEAQGADLGAEAQERVLPLAAAQRRIWFVSRLGPAQSAAYNLAMGMRLRGPLDPARLQQALDLLCLRHDALRCRIVENDGVPQLHVSAAGRRFRLQCHDLSADPAPDAALDARIADQARTPFDLAAAPLARAGLITLARDEHVFVFTLHHVIADATTQRLLARDLGELYAMASTAPSLIGPAGWRFVDAIRLDQSEAAAAASQPDYWRHNLLGAPALSALPTDRPRPAQPLVAGAFQPWNLTSAQVARLRAYARHREVSLFAVLLSGWLALGQRLAEQRDFVVGVAAAGRESAIARDAAGCFVTTLPVRVTVGEAPRLRELLEQTAAGLQRARAHQALPFEQIVEQAAVERGLDHHPLFQSLFTWLGRQDDPGFRFDGVEVLPLPATLAKYGRETAGAHEAAALILHGGTAAQVAVKLDLSLTFWQAGDGVYGGLEYATALYESVTAQRLLRYWTALLEAFAADDGQTLDAVDLLTPVEREQVLVAWNDTFADYGRSCVHELFELQAARTPDAPALEIGARRLSYAQLDERAGLWARQLRQLGLGAGDCVGVAFERSADLVVALLAVLKSGAAYVPLDTAQPARRIAHAVTDSGARLVLTDDAKAEWIALLDPAVRVLDACDLATAQPAAGGLPPRLATPDDLAYVIYTSGTTGLPKGVMIAHAGVGNLLRAMAYELGAGSQDRMLALTTIGFDIAALELFLPLITGGCVVLAARRVAQDPYRLQELLECAAITIAQATPTGWRLLLDAGWRGREGLRALCGGEALPAELARRLERCVDALWNVYGPTETTIWSTLRRVDGRGATAAIESIGRPLANTRVYVRDRRGNLLPAGLVGELCIGGAGVARGYVNRPELDAERFVADPFVAGGRLYRTGDLARWRHDGCLEFLGRNDAQVKINGFRIELGEIEARLYASGLVREAAVVVRDDAAGHARLVVYYVPAAGADAASLREALALDLPAYMVPERYVALDALPVSANGKVDRKALPSAQAPLPEAVQKPLPGLESEIAAIWSTLLGLPAIDRNSHFFRLGGHSLLAVQMIARVRAQAGVDVDVSLLFAHPQLAAFAAQVAAAETTALPPLLPQPRPATLPLSLVQQRLWLVVQMGEAASRAYHMPLLFRVRGQLDAAALQQALDALAARHETLRTVMPLHGDLPRQQVLAAARVPLRRLDGAASDAVAAEIAAPFDLVHELPLRAALLPAADGQLLILTLHHIAADGWSLAVFVRELAAFYDGCRRGAAPGLAALPVQYADYTLWQRQWLRDEALQRQLAYWRRRLEGAPVLLPLPTDRPRPARQDHAGELVDCRLPATLTQSLREVGDSAGATLFMTLLAAWAILLSRLSGARDLVIGVPLAGRARPELDDLIGLFANTVALRLDLSDDPSPFALLRRVRSEVLLAQQHGDVPFEQVVDALQPPRSPAHTALFQAALAWQSVPPPELVLDGLAIERLPTPAGAFAKFDLTLYLWEDAGAVRGQLEYASALFERATAERWLEHWQVLLQALAADPHRRMSLLPWLTAGQYRRVTEEWAQGPRVAPPSWRVHERVAAAAAARPQDIAVVQRERRLDYAALVQGAARLAAQLRAQGLQPGECVAVCLPRSIEFVLALVAVLQAGGAYLIIDPALPAQRIADLLQDSGARLLIGGADPGLPAAPPRVDVAVAFAPAEVPPDESTPVGELAYLVYTSGSTGRPKGIAIRHASLANFVQWCDGALRLAPGSRNSCVVGLAFDALAMEIWPTLCAGATLVLAPVEAALDPDALLQWWAQETLDCGLLPTSLAEVAFATGALNPRLRTLIVGGARLTRLPPARADLRVLNMYGPAEATVAATSAVLNPAERTISIGRPLDNVDVYLLDERRQPVPPGVVGELHIAGAGVAAGYLQQPELDAERFVACPFGEPGARMYASGDLARWLPDGRIEFVGRRDDQVKLRGLRVEPGEIETRLAEHADVREAVVLVKGEQLVAYVAVQENAGAATAQVERWRQVHEAAYRGHDEADADEFGGWNSSYTGEPIARAEMREWQEQTLQRLRGLAPRRVLEIGCGSGLLLLPLAPDCERYVGLDLSAAALQRLAQNVARRNLHHVRLVQGSADDLSAIADERYDTVIVNSVAQYFPDRDYLDGVLRQAVDLLQPDGRLFIGDVRNLLLAADFHRGVQAARGAAGAQLDEAVRRALAAEPELLIAPHYFVDVARRIGLGSLQLWPKSGADNELTRYRYDAVLHRRRFPTTEEPVQIAGAAGRDALEAAVRQLQAGAARVAVLDLPNAALFANRDSSVAMTPAAVLQWLAPTGCHAELSCIATDANGRFHALLSRDTQPWAHERLPHADGTAAPAAPTNTPPLPEPRAGLRRELRDWLAQRLPDYMVPSQLILLRRLPLTPNGKVDTAALPPPLSTERHYVAPRTAMERLLAAIWSEVLAIEPIGARDDFFALGGHSLAAVQVVARLRRPHDIAAALPQLFEHPVLADLALVLAPGTATDVAAVEPVPRDGPLLASFEQESLWFLANLPGGGAAYNMFLGLRLHGRLDEAALESALNDLLRRHEVLRTGFVEREGQLTLRVTPAATARFVLSRVDLRAAAEPEQALADLCDDENGRQFAIADGGVIRGCLARRDDDGWALLISLHHIAGDGWSFRVLLRDLAGLYVWRCGGAEPPAPAMLAHADYAAWQRKWAERHFAEQSAYWRGALTGAPPLLELPADRVRPKQQDFAGAFVALELDAALCASLRETCRHFGTTPFVLLLAGWSLLLSRLSGQDEVVVGVPSANRDQAELEDVIGLFVTTLALRLTPGAVAGVAELLAHVEAVSLAAQQHQNIPFEQVVELARPARSLAYNPLFQAMFAWQSQALILPELPGLAVSRLADPPARHAKFDLTLVLADAGDTIVGGIEYATALFDAATMHRYAEHFTTLLRQLCVTADRPLAQLELLGTAQRRQLLQEWNATARPFPSHCCLHELVEQAAADAPDAVALVMGTQTLSYAELDARADALAAVLLARGLRAEERVAICIARSPEMIVAVLGVLKAGGAYVPLDLSHPPARIAHVLGDSAPRWVLLAGEDELADHPGLACIDVTRVPPFVGSRPAAERPGAGQLAYVIYTSGSTGAPKGVMVEHRSVVNRLVWMRREFAMGAAERVLQKTALSFDVSVWEIFMPLIGGGCLVLAEPGSQRDPLALARVLRERRITTAHFVPSMLQVFLAELTTFAFPDLVRVVCSGEELPPAVVEDFQRKLSGVDIYNFYGPTEAAIEVSWHRCLPDHGAARVPIGRPIDNCRLYVLDKAGRLQPPGAVGELYIAGTPVARGYLNRDTLTAERFLADPFGEPGGRMYRSGDLARWTPGGEIDFLGRNDAQIKLRGFRIELSEIESQLARHPDIAEAAVALSLDAVGGPALVAYWIAARADVELDAEELRTYLAAALPEYMLPAGYRRLDRLPLNANGKLDRDALPALAPLPAAGDGNADDMPQGDTERAIAAAWQDVLGRGGFGREDNFFALGGHSLLTLRLRKRLEAGGLLVEIADLFRYPSIAGLATALVQREAAAGAAAVAVVRAEGEGAPLFLLHDGFGLTLYAHGLAARLGEGFPVYALEDTAAAQDESASIALLADRLFSTLRAVQPQGPYRLAGWSFGGVLAYELATRLVDAGERVAYLGLIDSYYRFDEPTTDTKPEDFAEVPLHVAALDPALRRQCLARHEIYALAARRHAARPLHLTVDLIKAQRCDFAAMQAWRGWERVLPTAALRLHEVPGCHYSMMTAPFVDAVAQALMLGLRGGVVAEGGPVGT